MAVYCAMAGASSNEAAPAKSRAFNLMRAWTIFASEPAVVLGKSFSIFATASSEGMTPPRVIERSVCRACNSAGVCCNGRQLATRKSGTMATKIVLRLMNKKAKRYWRSVIIINVTALMRAIQRGALFILACCSRYVRLRRAADLAVRMHAGGVRTEVIAGFYWTI